MPNINEACHNKNSTAQKLSDDKFQMQTENKPAPNEKKNWTK